MEAECVTDTLYLCKPKKDEKPSDFTRRLIQNDDIDIVSNDRFTRRVFIDNFPKAYQMNLITAECKTLKDLAVAADRIYFQQKTDEQDELENNTFSSTFASSHAAEADSRIELLEREIKFFKSEIQRRDKPHFSAWEANKTYRDCPQYSRPHYNSASRF